MKPRRRSIYYPPTFAVDLDCPPGAVAQVEIKFPLVICDPQIDGRFLTVKQGLGLEQLLRGADGVGARARSGIPVIAAQQEELKRPGADGVILPMAIDAQGSPAVLVRIVKELDSGLQHQSNQPVRCRPTRGLIQANRLAEHMLNQVRFFVFLEEPAPALPGERMRAPDRGKGEHGLGRDQQLRIFRDPGLKFAQEEQGQLDGDAASRFAGISHLHNPATSFLDLARLQRRHRVCRLDSSVLPPLLTGTM